jgi:hypothetical protein
VAENDQPCFTVRYVGTVSCYGHIVDITRRVVEADLSWADPVGGIDDVEPTSGCSGSPTLTMYRPLP